MSLPVLRLIPDGNHLPFIPAELGFDRMRIGEILVRMGVLSPERLLQALVAQPLETRRLGDILVRRGWVDAEALAAALAFQNGAERADFTTQPPTARLIDRIGAARCLRHGLLPWKTAGAVTVVATARPAHFIARRAEIESLLGPVRMAIATETEVEEAILSLRKGTLARYAERRVPIRESCRGLPRGLTTVFVASAAAVATMAWLFPKAALAVIAGWAILALVTTSGLRAAAATVQVLRRRRPPALAPNRPEKEAAAGLPVVSLLVPLFREREIAERLVRRLERLDYPPHLLDICLVVEEDDRLTRRALAASDLPPGMRQIVVPEGAVRTKPRALNYALDFCRGSIVGIYDAEDAPAPDQIRAVVRGFRAASPDVACLQGVLDFYNARTNWLSRCFAIDYATWFRIVLPGLARLGFVVPLGGTTLFFRREALESLGGWDAHNVTEDADLGLRLARHGLRTELIDTVTEEEANCRAWPWVRQRSRWLKGYAMTWASHMRAPRRLWRELGPRKFFGVQVLFLGTLSTFVLAPVLWSFWLLPLGLPHPLEEEVPSGLLLALGAVFVVSELVNITAAAIAVATRKNRWLIPWVPTLTIYFALGALASWKALVEIAVRPFYWDKTAHGIYGPASDIRRYPPRFRRRD